MNVKAQRQFYIKNNACRLIPCTALVLIASCLQAVRADVYTWLPTTGTSQFSVAVNWTPNGMPGSADDVYFNNDTGTISLSGAATDAAVANAYFSGAVSTTGKTAINTGTGRSLTVSNRLVIDGNSDLWLSGGTLKAGSMLVGSRGTGTFKLRSTTARLDVGSLTLSSGSTLQLGQGTLISRASSIATTGTQVFGSTGGVADSFTWNMSGTNTMTGLSSSNGTSTVGVIIGASDSVARGIINVSGAATTWNIGGGDINIGISGSSNNELHITDGAVVSNTGNYSRVGAATNTKNNVYSANNSVEISGPKSQWNTSNLIVGNSGGGNLINVHDGGGLATASATIGNASTSTGNTVTVSGNNAQWNNAGAIILGSIGGNNQLNIASGGAVVTNSLTIGQGAASTGNILKINGGSLTSQTLTLQRGSVQFSAGTLNVNSLTVHNGTAFVVGDGSNAATLNLISNATASFDTGLIVSANSTLAGTGTISAGTVTVQGTLAIGNSAGAMQFGQGLVLGDQATSIFEFTDPLATSGSLDLASGNTVTLGGLLQLHFAGGQYVSGTSFQIFQFSSYAGAFDQISVSGLGADQTAAFDSATGTVTVTAVPEAGGVSMLALALAGYFLRRRA